MPCWPAVAQSAICGEAIATENHNVMLEQVFLSKARELGDRLLVAFNTPSGLPPQWFNLRGADEVRAGVCRRLSWLSSWLWA
jgi:hypothetical protein